jgi:multiple sugar transport system permease protein
MLPGQVYLIPRFILFHDLGWIDTLKPLWVPAWFGGNAFAIFLMRQFLLTLPRELDEAAIVDGAGYFRIFWEILAPLCKPAIATLAVLTIIANWDSFLDPVIFLQSPEKFTVAIGIWFFKSQEFSVKPTDHLLMAAAVTSVIPPIILFFSFQRYFVRGIVLSGLKE